MSNLSLFVDCNKIIKWLQQRKKLPKDWYNYVKAAQQKTKILLKQNEDFAKYPQLKQLISQNHENFCYYDVNNLVQLLLKTDIAQQKSLLFGYNDKRVKEWTNLKKFMDSKSTGLLTNAKFIQQSLKFDLPALDKNIQMKDTQITNLKRKIDFNQNTIFQLQSEMKKQIVGVGLQISQNINLRRFNVQAQIPQIIQKVPNTMKQIQTFVSQHKIKDFVSLYKKKLQKDDLNCQLPLLQYFLQHNNDYVDVYKGLIKRQIYESEDKYRQFKNWRPVNQWQIVIQNQNKSLIQEIKLNYTTLLQQRETRQQLLYNLNELMYFFVGLKSQSTQNTKKLKLQVNQINLTEGQLQKTINTLQQLINLINIKRLLTPLELKNNKKSYQYFVSKFHNIEKNIQTLSEQTIDYRKQIESLQQERNLQVQKLRRFRKKVISVKKVQEKLLSDFIGKEVRINGEINKLE